MAGSHPGHRSAVKRMIAMTAANIRTATHITSILSAGGVGSEQPVHGVNSCLSWFSRGWDHGPEGAVPTRTRRRRRQFFGQLFSISVSTSVLD